MQGKKGRVKATCHPDRLVHARGLCDNCYKLWQYDTYGRHKVYATNIIRFAEARRLALQKLGDKCNWPECAWTDERAFQIDHIASNGAKERKEEGLIGYKLYRKILSMENPNSEYQILCANHNTIKAREREYSSHMHEETIKWLEEIGTRLTNSSQKIHG